MIRFAARTVRRLVAVGVLLALLVGAPWALWKLGRPLLPDHIPGLAEIWGALTERDTGQILLGTLAVIGFVAWAVFAVSVLAEAVAVIARRPAIRLPGLRIPQTLAAGLIALIIATGPAAITGASAHAAPLPALPTTPVAAVALHTPHAMPDPANAVRAAPASGATTGRAVASTSGRAVSKPLAGEAGPSQPVWTVRKGDTLWDIAEATLGDPLRCTEIGDLNRGHLQPDGKTFTADDFLLPGWRILLPADAKLPPAQANPKLPAIDTVPSDVVVQPGGTLSQIALDTLGDAAEYPAIAEANHIANPDLIHPGQIIHIPTPATPSGTGQLEPQTETDGTSQQPDQPDQEASNSHHADTGTSGGPAPTVDALEGASPANDAGDANDETAPPPGNGQAHPESASSAPTIEPSTPTPDEPNAPTSHDAGSEMTEDPTRTAGAAGAGSAMETPPVGAQAASSRTLVLGSITGLTAALAWAGLLMTRRRLQQRRRPGEHLPPPLELEARVEKTLRRNADPATPDRINQALRHATAALSSSPSTVITGILIGPDAIELRPANPADPPTPITGTATTWTLPLPDSDTREEPETERLAALPALATIGTTGDGRIAMINIEAIGALHINGDEQRSRELVNHLIVELSQTPWTDGIHLHLTDRPDGLRALDEDRIQTATDAAGSVRSLAAHVKAIRKLLTDRTITQARTDTRYADAWEPHLLITDAGDLPDDETTENVIDLLQTGPPAAAGLITTGHDPGITTSIQITADGTAAIPTIFPDHTITAAAVTDTELAAIVGLYAARPAPPTEAVGDDPGGETPACAASFDEACLGDVSADMTTGPDDSHLEDLPTIDDDRVSNIVILDGYKNGAATTLTGVTSTATVTGVSATGQGDAAGESAAARDRDGTLDEDLTEWHAAILRRPKVAILGPATVIGLRHAPGRPQPRQVEMAVYLALYSQGVTVDKFTADLWPEGAPPTDGGRRAAVSRLRSWLGEDPDTGEPFVPNRENGYYITDRLLDAELFDRLARRSSRRARRGDLHDALANLQQALALVRGPILPEAGGHDYVWLSAADRMEDQTLPVAIVDAAHAATDLALTVGDSGAAESAAMTGRTVQPYSLIPLCDLIRVAQYRGDSETAAIWARAALTAADAYVPAELPDPAAQLVANALPNSRREPSTSGSRP